jgi:succinate dehydrogenase / fumarate reductase cytochrome b subunit
MNAISTFWRSTIGKKVVMAVTGVLLIAFILSHVLANLLVFRGPEPMREYALMLRSTGGLLWLARGGLLLAAVLHIVAAVQLTRADVAARPVGYRRREPQASTFASRTIRWGGLILLFFVVFHLLHFTTGDVHPDFQHLQPYHNIVVGFSVPWVAALYVVAMAALGLHLYHGTWAAFRSLGIARPSSTPFRRRAAAVLAIAVWLGFTIIPVAVLAGLVRPQ